MKTSVLLILGGLLAHAPLQAQSLPLGHLDEARDAIGTSQILVWNRAGEQIELEVWLGKERFFAGVVDDGAVATSIEVARVLQRTPGVHEVRVVDRTRRLQDSVLLRMGDEGQNVGIRLTDAGLAFVVTQGDVTAFTPPPSTHAQ